MSDKKNGKKGAAVKNALAGMTEGFELAGSNSRWEPLRGSDGKPLDMPVRLGPLSKVFAFRAEEDNEPYVTPDGVTHAKFVSVKLERLRLAKAGVIISPELTLDIDYLVAMRVSPCDIRNLRFRVLFDPESVVPAKDAGGKTYKTDDGLVVYAMRCVVESFTVKGGRIKDVDPFKVGPFDKNDARALRAKRSSEALASVIDDADDE